LSEEDWKLEMKQTESAKLIQRATRKLLSRKHAQVIALKETQFDGRYALVELI